VNTTRPRAQTPSQTVGPFFNLKLRSSNVITHAGVPGQPIRVQGLVLDGDGAPIDDALIELWQADRDGRYDDSPLRGGGSTFVGFGRAESAPGTGAFHFETIKPGAVRRPDGTDEAPHLNLIVFARGMLNHLFTRMYFADEPERNAADPVLARVPSIRRPTLIAAPERSDATITSYRFDIRLQGDDETVFFDV